MAKPTTAPFGSWRSPITPELVASGGVRLDFVQADGPDLYWLEGRPTEGGRYVLARRTPGGEIADVTPEGMNVRTTVHEYGGGAYTVRRGVVYFANFADQRLYRQLPGGNAEPITAEPEVEWGWRYADLRVTPDGRMVYCVRETHFEDREAVNEIVALPTNGSQAPTVAATGHDFFSSPRISRDGRRLAWVTWDHPRMPWDGSTLWTGDVARDGDGRVTNTRAVAGGQTESVMQPEWGPDGRLYFISDRTGWWNLYVWDEASGGATPLAPMEAECGAPQWVFHTRAYAFLGEDRAALSWTRDGMAHMGVLRLPEGRVEEIETPYISFGYNSVGEVATLPAGGALKIATIGASASEGAAVVVVDTESAEITVIKRSSGEGIDPGYISAPEAIQFPTGNRGRHTAHALYYRPVNKDFEGPEDELPPLIVMSHGGPTGQSNGGLSTAVQFWTSRGFGVVDVNYRGSSGYGRAYRELLNGNWGIADTEDCINAARWLAESGRVDGRRLAIRGGSAGGYTTLCALVFHDVFSAGASYYGVADPSALAEDTHKFESRYLDGLIAPYPERKDVYDARSPIHHVESLSCPVIIFQGLEDKIVPPSQADMMVEALRKRGIPFAYVPFEGEQHGFRRAENVQRAHEAELYFYSRVFGFELGDPVDPVEIEGM